MSTGLGDTCSFVGGMTGLTFICRLSSLEELSGMETLASDKTGTLTLNKCGLCKLLILTHLHDVPCCLFCCTWLAGHKML